MLATNSKLKHVLIILLLPIKSNGNHPQFPRILRSWDLAQTFVRCVCNPRLENTRKSVKSLQKSQLWYLFDNKNSFSSQDIFYSGSIYNLKEYKEAPTVQEYVASITSLPVMAEEEPRRTAICTCLPDTMADILSGNVALVVDLFILWKDRLRQSI